MKIVVAEGRYDMSDWETEVDERRMASTGVIDIHKQHRSDEIASETAITRIPAHYAVILQN